MSFSLQIKKELEQHMDKAKHCQTAELAGILDHCLRLQMIGTHLVLLVYTENFLVIQKSFWLIQQIFQIKPLVQITVRTEKLKKKSKIYRLWIKSSEDVQKIYVKLTAKKLLQKEANFIITPLILQNACCKRAFLRGTFLATGSMSDPSKSYHFEIVTGCLQKAKRLQEIFAFFELEAKIILRKKYYVLYMKEGEQIVQALNVLGAHNALMELENIRIWKEIRNVVNRKVNCETANLNKTVVAANQQLEDILYLQNTVGLGTLPKGLEEIGLLRMAQPNASLKELGEMLCPPIGKSGVNHRLRKLSLIADNLRKQKEDNCYDQKEDCD